MWRPTSCSPRRRTWSTRGRRRTAPRRCGPKGQVYDGWETRRHRRKPGNSYQAVVRLGLAGTVTRRHRRHGVLQGGDPPAPVSVEAASVPGYPSAAELQNSEELGRAGGPRPRRPATRRTSTRSTVRAATRTSGLTQHPDGGVARLRVHGTPIPDPDLLDLDALDLAALENGAIVTGCSNKFYSCAPETTCSSPGLAAHQAEGWGDEARRRDDGNDWVTPSASRARASSGSPSWTRATSRATPGLGIGERPRHGTASGSSCCRRPACSRTPATVSR